MLQDLVILRLMILTMPLVKRTPLCGGDRLAISHLNLSTGEGLSQYRITVDLDIVARWPVVGLAEEDTIYLHL